MKRKYVEGVRLCGERVTAEELAEYKRTHKAPLRIIAQSTAKSARRAKRRALDALAMIDPPPMLRRAVMEHYCRKGKKCFCKLDANRANRCGNFQPKIKVTKTPDTRELVARYGVGAERLPAVFAQAARGLHGQFECTIYQMLGAYAAVIARKVHGKAKT